MPANWQEEIWGVMPQFRSRPQAGKFKTVRIAPIPTEGLILEFSGVIFDPTPWRRWLFQLVSRMGLQAHYQTFHRMWDAEYQDAVNCGRVEYWEAMRAFLATAGLSPAQIEEVEAAGRQKYQQLECEARPLPGVISTLTHLNARGFKLVLLGNVPLGGDELRARVQQMQLGGKFHAILSREDFASTANRRDRTRLAAVAIKTPVLNLAIISCDTAQLRAAASVGVRTIAFNHDTDAQADIYLDQFDQLTQVVYPRQASQSVA